MNSGDVEIIGGYEEESFCLGYFVFGLFTTGFGHNTIDRRWRI
jgi:hypothetical protein